MPSRKAKSGAPAEDSQVESSVRTPPRSGTHAPDQIAPELIRRNPRNPRRKFDQKRIEALAASLNEVGMLVPLTVYAEPGPDGAKYTLLDGERRLLAAKVGNWATVPAWVTDAPKDNAQNTLRMFNIHLMRDEWGDMATTLALKEIMDETRIEDERTLSHLTGLSKDTVRNMKRVLEFPQEWQDRVLNDKVPFNLLVELDKAILNKKSDPKKAGLFTGFSEKKLRDFFLKGYDNGLFSSVVELRNVGALIDTASSEKNSERVRRRAKHALSDLLRGRASIDDAYQYGAAASIGIKQVLRDVDNLPGRLEDVVNSDMDDDDRARLRAALQRLREDLGSIIKRLA